MPCSDAIESGFCLELLAPYLRLFSFCDYTIQYPKEFVYSQISQTKYELFVHVMDRYCARQRPRVALAYLLSATPLGVTGIWLSVPIGWALADAIGIGYYLKKHRAKYAVQA